MPRRIFDSLSEEEISEAMVLERKLTLWQAMMLVSIETETMGRVGTGGEPESEPSQMLELERMGLLTATDLPGQSYEVSLTSKGEAAVAWFRAVLKDLITPE